jgi:iron complex transport system permease protein
VLNWTLGGVQVNSWSQLAVTAPLILAGAAIALLIAHPLNLVLLGEQQAAHLGVRVERLKLAAIVLAALLTALAVTLAGVVAFVGLVVPHSMRLIYGPGHKLLLPASCLAGATFVVLCDIVARVVVAPTEVPLGVITAILGAPFFLYLLRRSRREYTV